MEEELEAKRKRKDWPLIIAWGFLFFGFIVVLFPWNTLDGKGLFGFYLKTNNYNEIGDFIGGVTSPLLSVSAFILLFITYKSQKKELVETNKILRNQEESIKRQQFETNFFNNLNHFHNITSDLIYEPQNGESFKGKQAISEAYKWLVSNVKNRKNNNNDVEQELIRKEALGEGIFQTKELYGHPKIDDLLKFKQFYVTAYEDDYISKERWLGHYFRFLSHLVNFVHNSELEQNDKKQYIDLIQAQMTGDELGYVFYNSLTRYSDSDFLSLLDEYSFLENIPKNVLFSPIIHSYFYQKTNFKFRQFIMEDYEKSKN